MPEVEETALVQQHCASNLLYAHQNGVSTRTTHTDDEAPYSHLRAIRFEQRFLHENAAHIRSKR
jgi:hypothetical protein